MVNDGTVADCQSHALGLGSNDGTPNALHDRLPLHPGERVILRSPMGLYSDLLASATDLLHLHPQVLLDVEDNPLDPSTEVGLVQISDTLSREYEAIVAALKSVVGSNGIYYLQPSAEDMSAFNRLHVLDRFLKQRIAALGENVETETIFSAVPGSNLYPRDIYTRVADRTFFNQNKFLSSEGSSLGEGGVAISAGNVMLVNADIFMKDEARYLESQGVRIGTIPPVLSKRQPKMQNDFTAGHIDGHANLVIGSDNKIHLLVTSSYFAQDEATQRDIELIAAELNLELSIVDDKELPPLALNFIQFRNGKTLCTSGEVNTTNATDNELTRTLTRIVGAENVIKTSVPLMLLPRAARASIRCMTNIVSNDWLK